MSSVTASIEQYTYLCFHLCTQHLDEDSRVRLEQLGIECVQEGGQYRAYGIIRNDNELMRLAANDPAIERVALGAPPSGF